MKKGLLVFLLILNLTACREEGTDTGNPAQPGDEQGSCGVVDAKGRCLPPSTHLQVTLICYKLRTCFGETGTVKDFPDCHEKVYRQSGLEKEIDLQISSFKEVDSLLEQGKIKFNYEDLNACEDRIYALACDSPILNDAFPDAEPPTYEFIHSILRADPACRTSYVEKE